MVQTFLLTSFAREPHAPPKDWAEIITDVCLYLPNTALGREYDLEMHEIRIKTITRIAAAVIYILGFVLMVPLSLIGLGTPNFSNTYYRPGFVEHCLEGDRILKLRKERPLLAIFNYGIRTFLNEDQFANTMLDGLNGKPSEILVNSLMKTLESYPTYTGALARLSADDDVQPDGNYAIAAHRLVLLSQTIAQFKHFIDAIKNNDIKIRACIEVLLQFFADSHNRNSPELNRLYGEEFLYLQEALSEEVLLAHIFEGKGLVEDVDNRKLQLKRLCEIFRSGRIYDRATSLLAQNS